MEIEKLTKLYMITMQSVENARQYIEVPKDKYGCYGYRIWPEDAVGAVKIGIANDVKRRLAMLQTGNPEKLVIHAESVGSSRPLVLDAENFCHRKLERARFKRRGEWFTGNLNDAYEIFFRIADHIGEEHCDLVDNDGEWILCDDVPAEYWSWHEIDEIKTERFL